MSGNGLSFSNGSGYLDAAVSRSASGHVPVMVLCGQGTEVLEGKADLAFPKKGEV